MVLTDAGFLNHVAVLVRSIALSLPYCRDDLGTVVVSDEHQASAHARLAFFDAGGTILQPVPVH